MPAGKKLSAGEKYLVVKTYEYIVAKKAANPTYWKGEVRNHVHDCLGYATGTISAIWGHWEKHHDPKFASMKGNKPSGRPRTFGESLHPFVRGLVAEMNKSGKPVAAPKLAKRLKEEQDVTISVRSLRRMLRRMGMRFIKGKSRNILAESTANVAFRTQYLKKKLANLNRRNFPVRPEVYLDETFCNLHHVAKLSWVDQDKLRFTKSGRGPRFCIVAAGVIHREKNGIVGELVEESREIWQSNLKRKHDDDYHGNFNTELFERWFANLSAVLAAKYGPCNIHMDGASYHKNQTNAAPNSSSLKAIVQAWLEENEIWCDSDYTKAELMMLVRANKPKPIYKATEIAVAHGHFVFFTPPYHPELQPIELIWAHIKGQIEVDPASNMIELRRKIEAGFASLESSTWPNAYARAQKYERDYMQRADECELMSDSNESADDSGDDSECD